MRNLRNFKYASSITDTEQTLTATAWACDEELICAFGPTKDSIVIQLRRWNRQKPGSGEYTIGDAFCFGDILASWDAPCPLPDLDCDQVINLHYFPDTASACLVLAGGDIVIVRESPDPEEEKIEIVGSVDVGISAASWSPDEELLVISTKADTLLYMTRDFENVTQVNFSSADLKISKHVSVGWGKSQTQFKGKGAKVLRDPTMPEKVDEGTLNEHDNRKISINWRSDGAFVAINSIEAETRRVIRVYSRDGTLDSVSEPVNGLTGALGWRPAGNLIASIQRFPDRIDVVFFERNGLRHGQFPLRLTKADIIDWAGDISVAWNVDSTVLAVSFLDRVQLWTMGNYHYYLKHEIFADCDDRRDDAIKVQWHSESPLRLALNTTSGVQMLEYTSVNCIGPTTPPEDFGVVAVIDGATLKVTPMRLVNIPPPMALHELSLDDNALDVAVSAENGVTRIGVLFNNRLSYYEWKLPEDYRKQPVFKWSAGLPFSVKIPGSQADELERCINQLVFFDQEDRLAILQGTASGTSQLIATEPHHDNSSHLVHSFDTKSVSVGLGSAVGCGRLDSVRGSSPSTVSLSSGRLTVRARDLARNCTSFLITPAHLIFTTSQHLLKFVHISEPENMVVPGDTPEMDERCRTIERGAKLVTVIPSIFALVLQMPRGNLETIYPRALVLAGIRDSIQEKDYKKAFLACRNHRVDMNILHDYNPNAFVADVGLFVDQVKKVEYIDLFLSQLRNEDVSQTIYRDTLPLTPLKPVEKADGQDGQDTKAAGPGQQSKVNQICKAFLAILRHRMSKNLQNVITAHVCKEPPDLDSGLSEIARLRLESPERAESVVEHICFLADANRLYSNALGLYNLELTVLVAQQTQKDPREYVPFLQSLQDMPTLRRQYSIDDYLGRHGKALKHLYNLEVFDEIQSYVVKYALYSQALEKYRYEDERLRVIMRLYADYLQKDTKYGDSGIAYEYLREYALASESYRLAHMWKESLSCAGLVPLPTSQIQSLARTLSEDCIEAKDFHAAAIIHQDYFHDFSSAARLYSKGYHYADAMRIISLNSSPDLLESIVDVGLVEGLSTMTELLADCKSQLNAQVPRIQELREGKSGDPLAFVHGDAPGSGDIPDNISLAPTDATTMGASLFTRYTNRTGTVATNATRQTHKRRQREERKRARGKKGSVYEEEYLVNSVGRLVDRVNSVSDEVERLVVGLMRRGMRERALAVEAAMVEIVALCKQSADKVFQAKEKETKMQIEEAGDEATKPTGGDGVLWDSIEGEQFRETPMVKDFSRLSLLGG